MTIPLLIPHLQTHGSDAARIKLAETISFSVLACPAAEAATAVIMSRFAKCFGGAIVEGGDGEAEEKQTNGKVVHSPMPNTA
jgi:hypothetical protein